MKRIVTGVNEQGRSCVVSNETLDSSSFQTVWDIDPTRVPEWLGRIDPELTADWLGPPIAGGLRWLLVPMAPAAEIHERPQRPGIDADGFHITRTLDLDFLIEGEVTLILDEDRIHLEKGDFVIQQATRHAWKNESDEPALLIAVLHRPLAI